MLKISYAGCLGISPAISSQISVKMCATLKVAKNPLEPLPFVGGGLRSFMVIDDDKSKKPVTSACCDKQHAC